MCSVAKVWKIILLFDARTLVLKPIFGMNYLYMLANRSLQYLCNWMRSAECLVHILHHTHRQHKYLHNRFPLEIHWFLSHLQYHLEMHNGHNLIKIKSAHNFYFAQMLNVEMYICIKYKQFGTITYDTWYRVSALGSLRSQPNCISGNQPFFER